MEEKMKIKGIAILAFAVAAFFTANMAWAGKIVIKGSTTVLPIAQKVSEAYMKQLKFPIKVSSGHAH
jgi:phosphate transport system substrate-binding protein